MGISVGTTEALDKLVETTVYEAYKAFNMGGRAYKPGDPVDVSGLSEQKIRQFLDQRLLRFKKS